MHQLRIGELGLPQRQPDAVHRVVGQPPRLRQGRPGRRQRIPRPRGRVGRLVLHGVQQMGQPPEQAPRLGAVSYTHRSPSARSPPATRSPAPPAPRSPPAGPPRRPAARCRTPPRNRCAPPRLPSSTRPGARRAPPACAPAARPRRRDGPAPSPRPAPARPPPRAAPPRPAPRTPCASRAADTGRPCAAVRRSRRTEPPSEPRSAARRSSSPPARTDRGPRATPGTDRTDEPATDRRTAPRADGGRASLFRTRRSPEVRTTWSGRIVPAVSAAPSGPSRFTRTHRTSPIRREESYFTHSQQPCGSRPLAHLGSRRMRCAPVPSQTPRAASIHLARRPHHG